jgi:large subunit ribosomal protein L20
MKSGQYAFRDRRRRKRDFRRLWIARISGACSQNDIKYSHLIHGLSLAGIEVNRKVMSELAIQDPAAFSAIVAQAKAARG